jgi:hypothetical protein
MVLTNEISKKAEKITVNNYKAVLISNSPIISMCLSTVVSTSTILIHDTATYMQSIQDKEAKQAAGAEEEHDNSGMSLATTSLLYT